ncbi:Arabinanase/levansucrase/invertase [Teratosphaeria nubilosa]|uniref:Arabinanase/levansucrase/invertase n=1 Tax=Teratosphaeria nubilosa TaxID=161662 RepID=A0A6G1KZY7_9PEZI|nr:Arabinanase/levansucrase/invertase [Teratosphaeria nubilosa]
MVLYNNACLDVAASHTPDPWVTHSNGKFYMTFTGNDRIPMWDAECLSDLYGQPHRGPVWLTRECGPQSERLWAPELHCLQSRWYIYFAAADRSVGNRSHRTYVLRGPPAGQDPHQGPWELQGPIRGMDQGQWAIDSTVFEIEGTLYLCYSGWPRSRDTGSGWEERDERMQQLFIYRLSDPLTASGKAIMISNPTETWERIGEHGPAINEGPQWLESPSGHWKGLAYSCSASWTKEYKMATLQYLGGDPLHPSSWSKSKAPLIQNRADGLGPYGPGHGCFLHVDGETLALFHATDRDTDGNQNRRCRMQRLRWTPRGPDMGGYVGTATTDVDFFLGGGPSDTWRGGQPQQHGQHVLRSLAHTLKGSRQ